MRRGDSSIMVCLPSQQPSRFGVAVSAEAAGIRKSDCSEKHVSFAVTWASFQILAEALHFSDGTNLYGSSDWPVPMP